MTGLPHTRSDDPRALPGPGVIVRRSCRPSIGDHCAQAAHRGRRRPPPRGARAPGAGARRAGQPRAPHPLRRGRSPPQQAGVCARQGRPHRVRRPGVDRCGGRTCRQRGTCRIRAGRPARRVRPDQPGGHERLREDGRDRRRLRRPQRRQRPGDLPVHLRPAGGPVLSQGEPDRQHHRPARGRRRMGAGDQPGPRHGVRGLLRLLDPAGGGDQLLLRRPGHGGRLRQGPARRGRRQQQLRRAGVRRGDDLRRRLPDRARRVSGSPPPPATAASARRARRCSTPWSRSAAPR